MNKSDKKGTGVGAPIIPAMPQGGVAPAGNMIVMSPRNFDDIQTLITNLAGGQSVICKLDGVSNADAQRMLDFMSGAAFALGGSMQRIETNMYLVTTKGVGITVK